MKKNPDVIQTHCGFKEPSCWLSTKLGGLSGRGRIGSESGMEMVNRRCDAFFAKRNMTWFARPFGQGDYYPKARQ